MLMQANDIDVSHRRRPEGVRARLVAARGEFDAQDRRYKAAIARGEMSDAAVLALRRRRAIERLSEAQAIADAEGIAL